MKRLISLFLLIFTFISSKCWADECCNITIVGIHGFMKETSSLVPIKKMLEQQCYDVKLWSYPSTEATIEYHATQLADYLACLAQQKPGVPIYFYTHSFGALVLRATLNMPNCPEEAKIGKAVLIAPTNTGSSLARRFKGNSLVLKVMGNKSGAQLMDLDICGIERCFGYFPESMRVLVIAGYRGNHVWFSDANDGWVSLDETALDTPYEWISLPYTHSLLLNNSTSFYYISNFFCTDTPASLEQTNSCLE